MDLYVNDQKVKLESTLEPNFSLAFQDTYNPSSVKSSYSKTVVIPVTKDNVIHDGDKFRIVDNSRILQQGYLRVDELVSEGLEKYYNVTLYGQLGDFFSNLNTGSLADLYYGWQDTPEIESRYLTEFSNQFVYDSWKDSSSKIVPVPCVSTNKQFDYKKTVIEDKLFRVPSGYSLLDGKYSIVETEESTPWLRQNFQTDLMPVGLKYSEIIKAVCNPVNNGGYTVNLDPTWFTTTNPYYEQLYVLFEQPTVDYSSISAGLDSFSLGNKITLDKVGSVTQVVKPLSGNAVWSLGNTNNLVTTKTILSNKVKITAKPKIQITSEVYNEPGQISSLMFGVQVNLKVTNTDTLEYRSIPVYWHPGLQVRFSASLQGFELPEKSVELSIPASWTSIQISYDFVAVQDNVYEFGLFVQPLLQDLPVQSVKLLFPGQSDKITLDTSYVDVDTTQYEYSRYTKQDLLGSSDTPLDYLLGYCKMFNLRFYQHPGSKTLDILTWSNYLRQSDSLEISDWIDYSSYKKTSKITDARDLHFGVTADENTTVQEWLKSNSSIFDLTVPVDSLNDSTQEYFSSKLRLGSRATLSGYYNVRPVNNLAYYGFDSADEYKISYLDSTGSLATTSQSLAREVGNLDYTILELSKIKNTLVLRAGTSVSNFGGETGKYPIAISRTSRLMVSYASKPCFVGGFDLDATEGSTDTILGCPVIYTYQIPTFDIVSNTQDSGVSLSFSTISYKSLNVSSTVFDQCFRTMLDQIYSRPLQVTTLVSWKAYPSLNRLYYFDHNYWMISSIADYNFTSTPVETVFTRIIL